MKNKTIRLFIVFIVMFTAMFVSQYTIVIAESNDIIYVSSSGSDNNSGTVDLKLKTLDKALTIFIEDYYLTLLEIRLKKANTI
ncbi:MAG: hypothetical protein IJ706_00095 [Clostridia bacterium]|nr:hypothetical protein [Clostridia bacterium]